MEVTRCWRQKAGEHLERACSLFTDLDPQDSAYKPLDSILAIAEEEFNLGNRVEAADNTETSPWAKSDPRLYRHTSSCISVS